ncbi:MAG: AraC family transcriptional regulator [Firmicutes bacterium]|nr:AraC family transcriptional regulator [Bacillota bacterium]
MHMEDIGHDLFHAFQFRITALSKLNESVHAAERTETGMTYVDFLTRVRLFRARNLLLDHPEMKLAEVARQCGFSSASYFGLLFRKDVGMTPGMFRLTERRS